MTALVVTVLVVTVLVVTVLVVTVLVVTVLVVTVLVVTVLVVTVLVMVLVVTVLVVTVLAIAILAWPRGYPVWGERHLLRAGRAPLTGPFPRRLVVVIARSRPPARGARLACIPVVRRTAVNPVPLAAGFGVTTFHRGPPGDSE